MAERILIMGAGGKDFHVFNTLYKNNPDYCVVAFTATQIPGIDNRTYPAQIAGKCYPKGIPILPESDLTAIIKREKVSRVIFAYSDVSYDYLKKREEMMKSMAPAPAKPLPAK